MAINFLNTVAVDDSVLFVDTVNDRVGIGTGSPEGNLEISDSTQATGATLSITNAHIGSWVTGDKIGSIDFRIDDTSTTEPVRAKIHAEGKTTGTYPSSSQLVFSTANANTLSEVMRIDSAGNVGIGKVPQEKNVLDIQNDNTAGSFTTHRNNTGFALNRTYADYGNDDNTVEYQERVGVDGNLSSIGNFSNHTLGIRTNNQDRITILADGNVGIGTTSPSSNSKLEVIGKGDQLGSTGFYINSSFKDDTNVGVFICHDDTVNTTGAIAGINQLSFITYGGTSPAWGERMKITGAGNVGIGTTSPESKLEVNVIDDGFDDIDVLRLKRTWSTGSGSDRAHGILFNDLNSRMATIYADRTNSAGNYNSQLLFSVNSGASGTSMITPMVINNLGRVGIGTTSPDSTLHVLGPNSASGGITLSSSDSDNTQKVGRIKTSHYSNSEEPFTAILTNAQTSNNVLRLGGGSGAENAATEISFYTAANNTTLTGSERMRITSSGNVGIGTTNPGSKLEVNGDIDTTGSNGYLINGKAWALENSSILTLGDWDGNDFPTRIMDENSNEVLRVTGGNVGIGTTSPGEKLDVNGNVKIKDTLLSNQENTDIDTGAEVVAQVAIAIYTAAFFDFVVKKTTNVRSGTVYACHDGTNVEFTETSTQDLGDTSDVTLSVDISGGNMRLLATVTSDDWSIKSLIRAI